MELRIILGIIWRRKFIILLGFLSVFLTAVLGSKLMTPVYESSSKIYIDSSGTSSELLADLGVQTNSKGSSDDIDDIIEKIKLSPLIGRVIEKLQLQDRKGNLMEVKDLTESNFIVYAIFPRPYVEVTQVDDTNLIEITGSSTDREQAAMIANTIATLYIEDDLFQRQAGYQEAKTFIEGQIVLTQNVYIDELEKMKRFRLENNSPDLDAEIQATIDRLKGLTTDQQAAVVNIAETQATIASLKQQLEREQISRISNTIFNDNSRIQSLKSNLSDLNQELAGALVEKTPDHPDVQVIQKKIDKIKSELTAELVLHKESAGNLQELQRQLASQKAQYLSINKEIEKILSTISLFPEKQFSKTQYDLSLSVNENLYSSLLETLNEIGLAQAMTLSDVKLVEPAIASKIDEISSPNLLLNTILGILCGVMFGFGLGFLMEYMDNTVKTSDDLNQLQLTHLGSVPRLGKLKNNLPSIASKPSTDPLVETYRTIRNSLVFASLDKPFKTLLVTSNMPNEGKSSNTVNLGISFAKEDKKVLLVDLDLRKPTLHSFFSISNSEGITNIIDGSALFDAMVKSTDIKGLDLLTTGLVPLDPGAMIESKTMNDLITTLSASLYDIVIIDSPPVCVAFDAFALSNYADNTILVLESGKATHSEVSQLQKQLAQCNIKPLGAILNKVKSKNQNYYYYSHKYYNNQS